eukprot:jgi/Tetstr1/422810/TSEL_013601.t1
MQRAGTLLRCRPAAVLRARITDRRVLAGTAVIFGGAAIFRLTSAAVVRGFPSPPALPAAAFQVGVRECRLGGIRARIFYPTDSPKPGTDGSIEEPYFPFGRATSDGLAGIVHFPSFLLAHLSTAGSGCVRAGTLAVRPSESAWPLLLYSHGYGGNADMGCYALRRQSSEGMVVVALEHQDGSASFAQTGNGTRVPFGTGGSRSFDARVQELLAAAEDVRSGALTAAMDWPESLVAVDRIAVGGHSYGCPTAMVACQREGERFSHAILHDPAITRQTQAAQRGTAGVPGLYVLGDGYHANPRIRDGVDLAMAGSASGSSIWHLAGAEHGNFVDAPFWAPLWVMRNLPLIPAAGSESPVVIHSKLAASGLQFLLPPTRD